MKRKYYYKVVGQVIEAGKITFYILGYTSSKKAWLRDLNGWEEKDLIFIRQKVKPSLKSQFLNA